jgi:hypothetical protein
VLKQTRPPAVVEPPRASVASGFSVWHQTVSDHANVSCSNHANQRLLPAMSASTNPALDICDPSNGHT